MRANIGERSCNERLTVVVTAVTAHLAHALSRMAVLVPPEHYAILACEGRLMLQSTRDRIAIGVGVSRVVRAAAWAEGSLE